MWIKYKLYFFIHIYFYKIWRKNKWSFFDIVSSTIYIFFPAVCKFCEFLTSKNFEIGSSAKVLNILPVLWVLNGYSPDFLSIKSLCVVWRCVVEGGHLWWGQCVFCSCTQILVPLTAGINRSLIVRRSYKISISKTLLRSKKIKKWSRESHRLGDWFCSVTGPVSSYICHFLLVIFDSRV